MKIRRSMVNALEALVREAGLEDEMKKLSEVFAQNFMISGEMTANLREILHRAPNDLIEMIWDKRDGKEAVEKANREQKEEILFDGIQEYFKAQLIFLDLAQLKLLLNIAAGRKVPITEIAEVYDKLMPYGWIFAFERSGAVVFIVPNEIKAILQTLKETDMQSNMQTAFSIRCAVYTCLGLYGVCKAEHILELYADLSGSKTAEEKKASDGYFQKVLWAMEREKVLWRDGNYIISTFLEDKEAYKSLLNRQKKQHYIPDMQVIKDYESGEMLVKDKNYKAVHKVLTREMKVAEMAEKILKEIFVHVIRDDWEIPQVMKCLYDWDIAFASPGSARKMRIALSDWLYGIRRWSECGYSRKELNMENTNLQYIEQENTDLQYAEQKNEFSDKKIITGKVYPNEPCPCGSGKKYKKCCGR